MDDRQARAAFIAGAVEVVGASTPQYRTLNDAAGLHDGMAPGATEIWYMRGDKSVSRDLGMGSDWLLRQGKDLPSLQSLEQTHVMLGKIKERDPRKIYEMMQGENWSPQGEAFQLVKNSGAWHTSMMVGDVIKVGNKAMMVDRPTGFYKIDARGPLPGTPDKKSPAYKSLSLIAHNLGLVIKEMKDSPRFKKQADSMLKQVQLMLQQAELVPASASVRLFVGAENFQPKSIQDIEKLAKKYRGKISREKPNYLMFNMVRRYAKEFANQLRKLDIADKIKLMNVPQSDTVDVYVYAVA